MKRARAICVLSTGGSLTCTANVCSSLMAGTPVRRDTGPAEVRIRTRADPSAGSPPEFWRALLPDSLQLQIQDVLAGGERLVDGVSRIRADVQGGGLPVSVVPVPEASPVTAPVGEPFMLIGQWHEPLPIRDHVDRAVVS